MNTRYNSGRWLAILLPMLFVTSATAQEPAVLPPAAQRRVDFVADIQPILAEHCVKCHGAEKQKSDYRLDVGEAALKGGSIGGAIVPGDSTASNLIRYVAGADEELVMPPKGERLSAEQVGVLRAWIDQGATWPDGADATPERETGWSLRPLPSRSRLSDQPLGLSSAAGVRNPIDAFVAAKLAEKGLTPSPEADRRTLIRRVYFDLIGLPPTPEEVERFTHDHRSDAYERLVDRLLGSSRYGERWARHWMDAVHFAETHGHDEDKPRDNAWPYRDYLIHSFNTDKPYGRFVAEQLAGDALYPNDPWATVALGFIAAGPWDQSSQMGILDETTDKKIAQVLDRDDMIAATMSTFVSATVHCARCHNHKFDPISQADYYALQAVFAGIDRAERTYDPDPGVHARRRSLVKRAVELDTVDTAVLLSDPTVQARAAEWEEQIATGRATWAVLDPVSFTSAGGATVAKQPDGSLLYGGPRPEVDTYTIVARTPFRGVTAVRLELLTDNSLPHQGPGRQDNGNLHLSEFRVTTAPDAGAQAAPVAIRKATADFSQPGWMIEMAIDGRPQTAWGIYPEVGKRHEAVFELAEPVGGESGGVLTFVLDQVHGGGHLIGRLRLSATTAPDPATARPLPDAITAILDTPAGTRTDPQRGDLARYVLKAKIDKELAALPPPRKVYAVASDFKPEGNFKPALKPREVHVLRRGDIHQPIEPAVPGTLGCVPELESRFALTNPGDEAARRVALARWVVDPRNVLTWRSIVNRVWSLHFGRGIVDTPNDFGRMGGEPTHPELLDWLAVWFRDDGGQSLKALHRLIVTSATYRQSSRHNKRSATVDADNRLLWRMNRARLDAESVRDAVLQMTGKLDLKMGGPSIKQFIQTPGVHVTPNVDYQGFAADHPANFRRAVYRFLFRTIPDPFMESMDCPDASQLTPARTSSMTALQALSMLNNKLIVRQCEHLAARLETVASDTPGRISGLYRLAYARDPTEEEVATLSQYADNHGLPAVCRLVINSNEFMFVD